jgi:hypothetical protein
MQQQIDGSRKFFTEMNSLGITGIVDGGGVSMYPANYQAVFKLWHDKQLTVRVAYHLCAPKPGSELADLENLTQLLPQGFGDSMLHFNGPGEILVWADWTDGDITSRSTGTPTAPWIIYSISSKTSKRITRFGTSAGPCCISTTPPRTT